jgi:hypothetical protein
MVETTDVEIINIIQNIKTTSSTEFDNISTQLMTNSMEHIASSLAESFNSII